MTEAAAFLQAILDAPEEDAPRLVLADWLDEHDEPERAESIRVGCELAKLPGCEFVWRTGQERPCHQTARPLSISCRYCQLTLIDQSLRLRRGLWVADLGAGGTAT